MEKTKWTSQDMANSKYIGILEFQDNKEEWHNFEVFESLDGKRLIFGGFSNCGFIESGYMEKDDFSIDCALSELLSDLEVYYNDGANYTSMIVCNDRM
jgi:hypothetical protein